MSCSEHTTLKIPAEEYSSNQIHNCLGLLFTKIRQILGTHFVHIIMSMKTMQSKTKMKRCLTQREKKPSQQLALHNWGTIVVVHMLENLLGIASNKWGGGGEIRTKELNFAALRDL